jgi:hypothetical protein
MLLFLLRLLRLLIVIRATTVTASATNTNTDTDDVRVNGVGCDGGACPSPFLLDLDPNHGPSVSAITGTSTSTNSNHGNVNVNGGCGFWLGPSHIKRAENHGFGLGIFTGLAIPKGTAIEPLYNGAKGTVGEPLLPFFGAETIYDAHPPLREYGQLQVRRHQSLCLFVSILLTTCTGPEMNASCSLGRRSHA